MIEARCALSLMACELVVVFPSCVSRLLIRDFVNFNTPPNANSTRFSFFDDIFSVGYFDDHMLKHVSYLFLWLPL